MNWQALLGRALSLAFLAVFLVVSTPSIALSNAEEPRAFGPEFEDIIGLARLDWHCFKYSPCMVPTKPYEELERALEESNWQISNGSEFVSAYRKNLAWLLIGLRSQPATNEASAKEDVDNTELALNVLPKYWRCLGANMQSADESSFATKETFDNLAKNTVERCQPIAAKRLKAIGYIGPDFTTLQPKDFSTEGASSSRILAAFQTFAIAYYAGLRGYKHSQLVNVTPIPIAERPRAQ
jgi:hypothetical protein